MIVAPWWWFPCKPKHVKIGAVLPILKCFLNSTFLNVVCVSWLLKWWIINIVAFIPYWCTALRVKWTALGPGSRTTGKISPLNTEWKGRRAPQPKLLPFPGIKTRFLVFKPIVLSLYRLRHPRSTPRFNSPFCPQILVLLSEQAHYLPSQH